MTPTVTDADRERARQLVAGISCGPSHTHESYPASKCYACIAADEIADALAEEREKERGRCAGIAESHIIPGHAVGMEVPKAIAATIREGKA